MDQPRAVDRLAVTRAAVEAVTRAAVQERFAPSRTVGHGNRGPYCAAHGPNESLHLGDFARTGLGEALLLINLAETWSPKPSGRS
jgi:hypothetical protein